MYSILLQIDLSFTMITEVMIILRTSSIMVIESMFILQIMMIEVKKMLLIIRQTAMIVFALMVIGFDHRQKVNFAVMWRLIIVRHRH